MVWALFLLSVFIHGLALQDFFFKSLIRKTVRYVAIFLLGSLSSVSFIYFVRSYILPSLEYSLFVYFFLTFLIILLVKKRITNSFLSLTSSPRILFFLFLGFIFSFYIFGKAFGYDEAKGNLLISSNTYLDHGVHIPFIRSFSYGGNFPSEVPFFANSPLLYHFMFDLYAGLFEFLGLRIDVALNLVSALSFLFLLALIYELSYLIFQKRSVGLISMVLFLFSSNLSFLNFVTENSFSFSLVSSFWHNSFYLQQGPFGKETIGVFWTLNAYLNQRQLVFGVLIVLFILYILLYCQEQLQKSKKFVLVEKQGILLGVIVGLLPIWHTSMFISSYILLVGLFIAYPPLRRKIALIGVFSLVLAVPQILSVRSSIQESLRVNPGFLISDMFTVRNFFLYWFWNLGIGVFTFILGFIFSTAQQKKLFLIFLLLFIVPNIFQLSNDMYNNHKFFNLWIILANFFSSFFIVLCFQKRQFMKFLSIGLFILLIASGFLNFMVLKNDVKSAIIDYPKNKLMSFIRENIPNDAIIVSNGEIYDPASLTGKKIFLGRAYYVYTYGGNPYKRLVEVESFFNSIDLNYMKSFLKDNKIQYVVIYKNGFAKNSRKFKLDFFQENFNIEYEDIHGIVIKV